MKEILELNNDEFVSEIDKDIPISILRPKHILKKLKSNIFPQRILFYDSETNIEEIEYKKHTKKDSKLIVEKHSIKLGYYEYCEFNKEINDYEILEKGFYYSKKEFCNIILNCYKRKMQQFYVFAHNQSFDFRVSVDIKLLENDFELLISMVDGFKFIMIFKHKIWKRRLIFLDSMNYFRTSIEKLGDQIGIKKIEIKDFKTVSTKKLKLRCKIDVEILRKTILMLIDFNIKNNCGIFGVTGAKQSFNAFRYNYMKHDIFIHSNLHALMVERKSYCGGRTECFVMGKVKDKMYKLDINSMYPYEMQKEKYPTKLIKSFLDKEGDINYDFFISYLKDIDYKIIATVEIEINERCIPFRDKENNCLLFPIGKFKTTLCEPELELVLQYGKINKIYDLCIYECEYIFKDYIKHFYKQRLKYKKENDDIFQYFTKIFMNSLYGKFGQKNKKWDRVPEYDYMNEFLHQSYIEFISKDDELIKLKFIGSNAFKEIGFEEYYNGFVAIASFVTSYSRRYLFEIIYKAGIVFYCDTDSIFTNKEGMNRLKNFMDDKKLGFLKVEDEGYIEIKGLKDYKFNDKEIIKGIKLGSKKLSENSFEVFRFTGFNEGLRYFDIENVYAMKITKTLKRKYKKGIVEDNGVVNPIVLTC